MLIFKFIVSLKSITIGIGKSGSRVGWRGYFDALADELGVLIAWAGDAAVR